MNFEQLVLSAKTARGENYRNHYHFAFRVRGEHICEVKEYVESYTDADVLFGRGGRSNHHPGNKIYRDIVTEKQPFYRSCDKNEKTKVAQSIVDAVTINGKGRFLELDKRNGMWYLVPNIVARRKVGQALRENNTEEARAAKREKYGQGKIKKAVEAVV